MCMERRLEPLSQMDASNSWSNFKIAFHPCVNRYFSQGCGAELGHVLVLLEENRRSTCFPSVFVIYFQPRNQPFCVYLSEIGREAIACMQLPRKSHCLWLPLPSLAEDICSAVGYDPTK